MPDMNQPGLVSSVFKKEIWVRCVDCNNTLRAASPWFQSLRFRKRKWVSNDDTLYSVCVFFQVLCQRALCRPSPRGGSARSLHRHAHQRYGERGQHEICHHVRQRRNVGAAAAACCRQPGRNSGLSGTHKIFNTHVCLIKAWGSIFLWHTFCSGVLLHWMHALSSYSGVYAWVRFILSWIL